MLIVGPSGVGKDTLISYCRSVLAGDDRVVFPKRTITRPTSDPSEDHDGVSEAAFKQRVARGDFAIDWFAHGLFYGVPISVERDLSAGRVVVVNVSRSVIATLRQRYRPLIVVSVTAERVVVGERLHRRGRETVEEIGRRLERGGLFDISGPDVVRLDNSGEIADAGKVLLQILNNRLG